MKVENEDQDGQSAYTSLREELNNAVTEFFNHTGPNYPEQDIETWCTLPSFIFQRHVLADIICVDVIMKHTSTEKRKTLVTENYRSPGKSQTQQEGQATQQEPGQTQSGYKKAETNQSAQPKEISEGQVAAAQDAAFGVEEPTSIAPKDREAPTPSPLQGLQDPEGETSARHVPTETTISIPREPVPTPNQQTAAESTTPEIARASECAPTERDEETPTGNSTDEFRRETRPRVLIAVATVGDDDMDTTDDAIRALTDIRIDFLAANESDPESSNYRLDIFGKPVLTQPFSSIPLGKPWPAKYFRTLLIDWQEDSKDDRKPVLVEKGIEEVGKKTKE